MKLNGHIDPEKMVRRRSLIARKAHEFLQGLKVPVESQFSDLSFLRHMRLKTSILNEKAAIAKAKKPRMIIKPREPGVREPNFEPIVLGGVAFYLDHVN